MTKSAYEAIIASMAQVIALAGDRISRALHLLEREAKRLEKKAERLYGVTSPLYNAILVVPSSPSSPLGSFISSQKVITISERVALAEDSSLSHNVLIHEMAHAAEYALTERSAHDTLFREIALALGIAKGFEKAKIGSELCRKDRKRELAMKLEALASSPFEAEAAEALKRARLILEEIGEEEEMPGDTMAYTDLYEKMRIPYWRDAIACLASKVSGAFIIKCLSDNLSTTRVLRAYGSVSEVELTLYIYSRLSEGIQREMRTRGASSINCFTLGAIKELQKKYEASILRENLNHAIVAQTRNEMNARRLFFKDSRLRRTSSRISIEGESLRSGGEYANDEGLSFLTQRKEIRGDS